MDSPTTVKLHMNSESASDRLQRVSDLAEAYKLGYRDGRQDEKHRPWDKVLRLINEYSS
jgi:hypothetical protein